MFRRALTILVVLSMAAFGYQPSLALMVPAGQTVAGEVMSTAKLASMPDCVSATAEHDCCDQTGKQKQNCAWMAPALRAAWSLSSSRRRCMPRLWRSTQLRP